MADSLSPYLQHSNLPTGLVTFLFTDIEGSTQRWERFPEAMSRALDRHHFLLRQNILRYNGYVFEIVGDAFCAVFGAALDALEAAIAIQRALAAEPWPQEVNPVRVRMALYSGQGARYEHGYSSYLLNRVARFLSTAHGGQVILSKDTFELVQDRLPEGVEIIDLGQHRLKDLIQEEQIFQLNIPDLPEIFPPLKTLTPLRSNLPTQSTSFIGRESALAEIKEMFSKTRLLTLIGTGGTGKTRLACQVAAELLDNFKDGVWLVELAALNEAHLVAQLVASTLGVREQPGREILETLIDYLREKELLLVLDNCEHLIEAVAKFAQNLLRVCPGLRILATSREVLAVGGESCWRVPSLSFPGPEVQPDLNELNQYEAIRLFVERSQAVDPEFSLTSQNFPAVIQICRQLDGIPLALELAAGRVSGLSVEQIALRLDRRFQLLAGGNRAALPRQQTLRALIDWSYTLLTRKEQFLFIRLALFAGGWSLEAAEAICQGPHESIAIDEFEVIDLLLQLVNKSMVMVEKSAGKERYRLLETIRQYALEKLVEYGQLQELKAKFGGYYLAEVKKANAELSGSQQLKWLKWLDREYDNLKAGISWSLTETNSENLLIIGMNLAIALEYYWELRGYLSEGRSYLETALVLTSQAPANLQADALNSTGRLAYNQGGFEVAAKYYLESLTLSRQTGEKQAIATSLAGLGNVAYNQGNLEAARDYHLEALALRRETNNKHALALSLNSLGSIADRLGDYQAAHSYHEEGLALKREMGDIRGMAVSLNNLGALANSQGDYRAAQKYFQESLKLRQELGDKLGIAISLNNLGIIANIEANYPEAKNYYQESLALFKEMEDVGGILHTQIGLGSVTYGQGSYLEAESHYRESLALAQKLGDNHSTIVILVELANLAFKQGQLAGQEATPYLQKATLLAGAVATLLEQTGTVLDLDERVRYEAMLTGLRERLGDALFENLFAEGKTLTIKQLLSELVLQK